MSKSASEEIQVNLRRPVLARCHRGIRRTATKLYSGSKKLRSTCCGLGSTNNPNYVREANVRPIKNGVYQHCKYGEVAEADH